MKLIKQFIISILLFASLSGYSQKQGGHIFKQHFQNPMIGHGQEVTDIAQSEDGSMLFATRQQLLVFDGRKWTSIQTGSSPIKFVKTGDGTYFLLCKESFGRINKDHFGQYYYNAQQEIPQTDFYLDLLAYKNRLFLQIDHNIIRYSAPFDTQDTVFNTTYGFDHFFLLDEEMYAVEGGFISWYADGQWIDININLDLNEKGSIVKVLSSIDAVYLFTENGFLLSFDGENINTIRNNELNLFLQNNSIKKVKLWNGLIIIGTLNGGAIMVDPLSGQITNKINTLTGMPDDEIFAIGYDNQSGLWLSHNYGLSRLSPTLDIRRYDTYPGMQAKLNKAYFWDDKLWVATNQGLYVLDENKSYDEKQIIYQTTYKEAEEKESNWNFLPFVNNDEEKILKSQLSDYKKTLRSRTRKKEIERKDWERLMSERESFLKDSLENSKKQLAKAKEVKTTTSKTIKKLVSAKDEFMLIGGLNSNVTQLIADTDQKMLFAGSAKGIYKIRKGETKAERIGADTYVHEVFLHDTSNTLYIAAANGLYRYSIDKDILTAISDIGAYHSVVVFENKLYATTYNSVETWSTSNGNFVPESMTIKNPFTDPLKLRSYENDLYLIKGLIITDISSSGGKFIKEVDSLREKGFKLQSQNPDDMWAKGSKSWYSFRLAESFPILGIFKNIKNIHYSKEQNTLWIINDENNIYRMDASLRVESPPNEAKIIEFRDQENERLSFDRIKLAHDNNGLSMQLSFPEYLHPESVEFQYYLVGVMDGWSEWSTKSEISFPFLPTGNYEMKIRAVHRLSQHQQSLAFPVVIVPPYWQRPWFITIEILFFISLIIISIFLNKTGRNSYFTQVVTFFTIILLFELIHFLLEARFEEAVSSSPIYHFMLNASIALTITPFERIINRLLVNKNLRKTKELLKEMKAKNKLT